MKRKKLYIPLLLAVLLAFTACDDGVDTYDSTPPAPPTGVTTYAGDGSVEIVWNSNTERDLDGYNVYYATDYWGKYNFIGETINTRFFDSEAVNGEKYYYAVSAYDFNGNESELSYNEVYGVARPQGLNRTVYDYLGFPELAGYSFEQEKVVEYTSDLTDFFFENYQGTFYIDVWQDTDIQDMGPTNDIYDIKYAPEEGWKPKEDPDDNIKYVEAIPGHTYVIWTIDNHFAKIRVTSMTNERMVFDWAYQLVEGEPMLKRSFKERKERSGVIKKVYGQ